MRRLKWVQGTYFGAATLRQRLHAFGGQNLDYKALCDVEVYDCLRDTWEQGAAMRHARRNCASAELEGRIYAIGGFDGTRIIDSVEAYDSRLKRLGAGLRPHFKGAASIFGPRRGVGGHVRLGSVAFPCISMRKRSRTGVSPRFSGFFLSLRGVGCRWSRFPWAAAHLWPP